jgi:hypothetical protein
MGNVHGKVLEQATRICRALVVVPEEEVISSNQNILILEFTILPYNS